jgi:transcriptional regulator with XRE-family HTH domain
MATKICDLNTVGGRLRYVRKCRRLRILTVAKYAKLTKPQIARWESSINGADIRGLRILAYFYKVDVNWLIYGGDELPCKPLTKAELFMAKATDISPETRLSNLRRDWPGFRCLPRIAEK